MSTDASGRPLERAPLFDAPGLAIPTGGSAFWFRGADGLRLRAATFPHRAASLRGSVVLSPGRTEMIEKYFEVIGELQSRGFAVLVHDWRGQGLSERLLSRDPLRGHARGWQPFVADYGKLLETFGPEMPPPWVALGHSMGAALTALALVLGERRFSAVALSAPMIGVDLKGRAIWQVLAVARLKRLVGLDWRYVFPPQEDRFDGNPVTHDRARWRRNQDLLLAHPELALGGPTWGWLEFALSVSGRLARAEATAVATPVSIVAAAEESLADNAATKAFARRMKAAYVEAPGALHEILMEQDPTRDLFWAEFDRLTAGLR